MHPAFTLIWRSDEVCLRRPQVVCGRWKRGGIVGLYCLLLFLILVPPWVAALPAASPPGHKPGLPREVPANRMSGAKEFQFPFQPYSVQVELMNSVYGALNDGQVGIFESPTGVYARIYSTLVYSDPLNARTMRNILLSHISWIHRIFFARKHALAV